MSRSRAASHAMPWMLIAAAAGCMEANDEVVVDGVADEAAAKASPACPVPRRCLCLP
jgi:hypothetical protein